MIKMTRVLIILIAFVLLAPSFVTAGSIKEGGASGTPGEWWLGEVPSDPLPSKHPILFVHGLNSSSTTWTDQNDMDEISYQRGYETAFIDLYPTKDMWENGALLSQKIKEVYNHFGEKVVVVAHSKGGIDTQTALVHYGADPYVERVITLSTPHYGSQLADLAYSSWAGWLAGILGSKNEATSSLQTGYMDYFRSVTDERLNVRDTPIYTLGGTKWGSFGSSLYWGGLYLRAYGSNDGAVTVQSSRLPYATELKVGDWNHTTIKEGSSTFSVFENYLNKNAGYLASFQAAAGLEGNESNNFSENADRYIHGGIYSGMKEEPILVEPGAESITVDWMSEHFESNVGLISPSGKTYNNLQVRKDDTAYLKGAYHHTATIQDPEAGEWIIRALSNQQEHYLLNVTYDSPLNSLLTSDMNNGTVHIKSKNEHVKVKTDMTIAYYKKGQLKHLNVKANKQNDSFRLPNLGSGTYNMTINVNGTIDKTPFQRTTITSVYVDEKGQLFGH